MSFCENVSDLFRELRSAAGTVLTILGSRLEAVERARVDEVGPQWLTEFEAERDVVESEQLFECVQTDCGCHADDRYAPFPDMCVCGHSDVDHYRAGGLIDPCNKCDCLDLLFKASAAVSAAADPSPATTTGCSRAGDEGPEGASAIPRRHLRGTQRPARVQPAITPTTVDAPAGATTRPTQRNRYSKTTSPRTSWATSYPVKRSTH